MLKYCNGFRKQLTIDIFYAYKQNVCKQCPNKKVYCDYCGLDIINTNLSKHIEQTHDNTYNRSLNNDSTSKSSGKKIVLPIDH